MRIIACKREGADGFEIKDDGEKIEYPGGECEIKVEDGVEKREGDCPQE